MNLLSWSPSLVLHGTHRKLAKPLPLECGCRCTSTGTEHATKGVVSMPAEVLPVAEVASRTFEVLLSEKSRVEAALAALAKRCARRGLSTVTIEWGKAYTRREHHAN